MPDLSKRRQRQLKNEGYDLAFLSQIQPQGNIDFQKDDRSWISGDGPIRSYTIMSIQLKGWIVFGFLNCC